tara:strand:+ start:1325 stop:1663 length:339 start_codon:yes stop_codon:yes gene_type:complete
MKTINYTTRTFYVPASKIDTLLEFQEKCRTNGRRSYSEVLLELMEQYNNPKKVKNIELFIDALPEKFKTSDAEKIAKKLRIKRRQMYNYLEDSRINKIEHGSYQKVFENGDN